MPKTQFDYSIDVQGFRGTANEVFTYTEDKPEKFDFLFTGTSKAKTKQFVQDFIAKKGRFDCFWFVDIGRYLTVVANITSGALSIDIIDNFYNIQGFERLYIELNNGDKITKKITGFVQGNGTVALNLDTAIDRDILTTDICRITFLHLCRFDVDTITMSFISKDVMEVSLSIIQVIKEQKTI